MNESDEHSNFPRSLRIGLTGGIASGKSTVANLFAEFGIHIIDADIIAREAVQPGSDGLTRLVQEFGSKILTNDQKLDRKLLRNIIFSDATARKRVEGILHPTIANLMMRRSEAAPGPYHLLDIPLLAESTHDYALDRVLVVDCEEKTQLLRIQQRDGETGESARRILAAQSSRADRLKIADDVIENNTTIAALSQQVYRLHQCYLKFAFAQSAADA